MSTVATPPPVGTPTRRRDVRPTATAVALAAVAVFAVVAWVALATGAGQRYDEDAMQAAFGGRDRRLMSLLGYVSIGTIGAVAIACVGLALARGRVRLALGALAVIGGANVTTQVLKRTVLDRADLVDGVVASNSLPSGHTTVVAAGVGALCLVSPRWLRPFVVPVGAFGVALTGASTVVAGWHRPSDVVAAVLVSLAWTAGVAAVVGGRHVGVPSAAWLAPVGAVAALLFLAVVGVRPYAGWPGLPEITLVLGSVAILSAVGVALMHRVAPTD